MDRVEESEIEPFFEATIEEKTAVFFHPVLPVFCAVTDNRVVKVVNFESGRCLALFELFAGNGCQGEDGRIPKSFICSDLVFADREATIWNSGLTGVAASLQQQTRNRYFESLLLLVDRHCVVRWEYLSERWAVTDVVREGKFGVTRACLYDQDCLILGYEDGALGLLNFKSLALVSVIAGGHKSAIQQLLTLSSNMTSKPLVLSLEREGQVSCWNVESKNVVFRLSETVKGKTVGLVDKLPVHRNLQKRPSQRHRLQPVLQLLPAAL